MIGEALALAPLLFAPEAYGIWGETIEARPDLMFVPVRERFRAGATVPAPDFVRGWRALDALRASYHAATAAYDAVLVPTAPNLPPNVDRLLSDAEYFATENLLTLRNTRIGNLLGGCSLTLPTGEPSCGVSLMAPPGAESRLLRLGAAAEGALG